MTNGKPRLPFDDLGAAILAKDAARAEEILARHTELKRRLDEAIPGGHFGATALLVAAGHRDRAMIDLLLREGADINARSHWWAGGFGVLDRDPDDLTDYLISRGATVDIYAASRHGRLDRVDTLLAADPSLAHARGGDGQTPLHVAQTVAIAERLVAAGADIDALDFDHESTPAQYLIRDHQDVVRYLIGRGCRTDILMGSALGDPDIVQSHLDVDPSAAGTTVSDRWFPKQNPHAGGSIYIWTLGHYKIAHEIARDFGHEEIVQLLMQRSPAFIKLAAACELGEEDLLNRLVTAEPGFAPSPTSEEARRLPDAANRNRTTAVRLYLVAGWPVDARGELGASALHWAGWNGNLEMVRAILLAGPSLTLKDAVHDGTPLGWAIFGSKHGWHCRTGDYAGVVNALLDAGALLPPAPGGAEPDASEAVQRVLRERRKK
jgi:Ankyrin repeats (3 copies)/Ankyrin repeat